MPQPSSAHINTLSNKFTPLFLDFARLQKNYAMFYKQKSCDEIDNNLNFDLSRYFRYGHYVNLKSEIQIMRYFHYYYETGIKSKSGIGLAEVWDMDQFKESEIIKDVEKQKKEKVTKFELNEINQSEFKSLSLLMGHRTPNDLTSSLRYGLKLGRL